MPMIDERRVLHFIDGIRGRAELHDYDLELDGDWPYMENTIVEIGFAGDKWLSNFASLSFYGAMDYPIFSSEERYWELFARTLEQLVFCLDVRVELTSPFFAQKSVNRVDVFETSNEVFADEFNRVFSNSEDGRFLRS